MAVCALSRPRFRLSLHLTLVNRFYNWYQALSTTVSNAKLACAQPQRARSLLQVLSSVMMMMPGPRMMKFHAQRNLGMAACGLFAGVFGVVRRCRPAA